MMGKTLCRKSSGTQRWYKLCFLGMSVKVSFFGFFCLVKLGAQLYLNCICSEDLILYLH